MHRNHAQDLLRRLAHAKHKRPAQALRAIHRSHDDVIFAELAIYINVLSYNFVKSGGLY